MKPYKHFFSSLPIFILSGVLITGCNPPIPPTFSLQNIHPNGAAIKWACFSPDDNLVVTANSDNTLRVTEVQSGQTLHVLEGHTAPVTHVEYSSDGKFLLSGSEDKTAKLWDAATYELVRTFQTNDVVEKVHLSAAEDFVVVTTARRGNQSASANAVLVFNNTDGSLMASLPFNPLTFSRSWGIRDAQWFLSQLILNAAVFSLDSTKMAYQCGTASCLAVIGKSDTIQPLVTLPNEQIFLNFSMNNAQAVTLSLGTSMQLHRWDLTTGKEVSAQDLDWSDSLKDWPTSLASPNPQNPYQLPQIRVSFSADGSRFLASNGVSMYIVDLETGALLSTFQSNTDWSISGYLSTQGKFLVSRGADGNLDSRTNFSDIYDVDTGKKAFRLSSIAGISLDHVDAGTYIFSSDGHRLGKVYADLIEIWDLQGL